MRLNGKVALITGAAAGIGRATAILFAQQGAKVVVADLNKEGGEETAHMAGNGAIAVQTDVANEESVERAIRTAVEKFGALHVLHNNAGGSSTRDDTVVAVPIDEFWRVISVDLFGTFLGCRFGIPAIVAAGGGSVINMASMASVSGFPKKDCYAAAKGGITAMTRGMAVEWAQHKVRVNAIAPGGTLSERVVKLLGEGYHHSNIAKAQPLGLIEPLDIANTALYLASDDSRTVTGQIHVVDGGVTVRLATAG
jgi:NAD(P)-dependent dehydrogenase (short-subunit alcohol dehydrogenase family)